MTLRYIELVNPKDPVAISGRYERERHGVLFCDGQIDQNGSTAVRATAKFMPMSGAGKSAESFKPGLEAAAGVDDIEHQTHGCFAADEI